MSLNVSVIGGSGYAGGELVRLLLFHPEVALKQVTSERQAGKFVKSTHPNLRGVTDLKFVSSDKLEPCDVLFLALPHGVSMKMLPKVRDLAPVVIDLSSDFRLNNAGDYPKRNAGGREAWPPQATSASAWPEMPGNQRNRPA